MERFSAIWCHPLYQEQFRLLQEAERERIFCNHTLSHFLDVARLMYLYTLTEQTGLPQDLIYAAALLHDIGRFRQLQDGTPHEEAGAKLAAEILPDCGYTPDEIREICGAILGHRSKKETDRPPVFSASGAGSVCSKEKDHSSVHSAFGTGSVCAEETDHSSVHSASGTAPDCKKETDRPPAHTVSGAGCAESAGTRHGELLAVYLRRADKKSRPCFCCPAAGKCNWPPDRRNSFPAL